jgi:hypothetical protein
MATTGECPRIRVGNAIYFLHTAYNLFSFFDTITYLGISYLRKLNKYI